MRMVIHSRREGRPFSHAAGMAALACVVVATCSGWSAAASPDEGWQSEALARLEASADGQVRLVTSPRSGLVRFMAISGGEGIAVSTAASAGAEERARAFLEAHGRAFGFRRASDARLLRIAGPDALGTEHVRFQQTHRGIPVTGAELIVHLRGARVTAANGAALSARDLADVEVAPAIDASAAGVAARGVVAQEPEWGPPASVLPRLELFNRGLFDPGSFATRLAWFVEVRAGRSREFVWVDARGGGVLLHFDQSPDARNRQIHDAGNSWSLPGTLVRAEGEAPTGDAGVDNAYDYAGDAHDYYLTQHGRDSYDGAGGPLVCTVHFGQAFQNAFWDESLNQAAFGDAFVADDVVAHEMTHGVTQYSAHLFYYKQSGALNESFSDVFGESVDLGNGRGTDTPEVRWLQGEDISGSGAIRSLMNPNAFGHPGKVGDSQLYCGELDNGGVHTNSGVPNHAYALMADGGSYNGQTVNGIGLQKAAAIMYRTLTSYLTTSSKFQDADAAIRQSCSDLVTGGNLTIDDCVQAGAALDAVEIGDSWPCLEPGVRVTKRGTGEGLVVSSPPGIDCGSTCDAPFPPGSAVLLLAYPVPGSVFAGWRDDCSGLSACLLMMDGQKTVTATFDLAETTHLVSVSTVGTGTVRSLQPGIDCGTDCEEAFPSGRLITLTAVAPRGYALEAWDGDCTGRGLCELAMDGPKTVIARFVPAPFHESTTLGGVRLGRAAWGDYDGDGDLDVVVLGWYGQPATIYRNDNGALTDSGIPLLPLDNFARWGDYDNDGDLDLVMGGFTASPASYETQLYRNDSGTFTPVAAPFVGVGLGASAAWGDYDNDGDLDFAIAGYDNASFVTRVYRNDHGLFVDSGFPLVGVYYSDLAWGDYDNDGDLDLVVSGPETRLYRNDLGTLVDSGLSLPRADTGSVGWADYDGDGDLDLALAGASTTGILTTIFRNDGGALVDSGIPLPGVYYGSATWGDYDGDGDPDLLLTGLHCDTGNCRELTKLFRNDGASFTEIFTGLPELYSSNVAWGDYDNDGRLDILMLGVYPGRNLDVYAGVFQNLDAQVNTPPSPPGALGSAVVADGLRLDWLPASDATTPSAGLSYNVRVGTTPGGSEIVSSMSDLSSGFRRVPQIGNAGQVTSLLLRALPHGRYYWGAQAVDTGWAASLFANGGSFAVNEPPLAGPGGPYGGPAGQAISFDGTSSSDGDGDALTYHWDFGDGTTGSGAAPAHAYLQAGRFTVTLVVNDGYVDSAAATTTAEVVAPSLSVGDLVVWEGNAGSREVSFQVRLSAASPQTVTVSYLIGGGTAVAGEDYLVASASGTLTFPPRDPSAPSLSRSVRIQLVGDRTPEPHETIRLTLSDPVNATLLRSVGTILILNDDPR